jgi:hypothetical protein
VTPKPIICVTDVPPPGCDNARVLPSTSSIDALLRAITDFCAESRDALVIEGGETIFDFATAKYSIADEHGHVVIHFWSEERNVVRRVLEAEQKNGVLYLTVQRFGQSKPSKVEICRERDRRSPTAKRAARTSYEVRLRRILERVFSEFTLDRLTSASDLERSLSPVYARGVMRRGNSAWAVLGVNSEELQAAVDGSLTFGMIWLDACRKSARRAVVEGLKLVVPRDRSAIVRERMANLNHQVAKFELYEFDEDDAQLERLDCRDRGNLATRLVHCPDAEKVRERFAASIARVLLVVPEADAVPLSSAEIAFRIHGLEFARARLTPGASFRNEEEILWGAGAFEVRLDDSNAAQLAAWAGAVVNARGSFGRRENPLWRAQPERWLESRVVRNIAAIDSRLDAAFVYSQVPAFSGVDRGMIDVLSITRAGRLAVLELKADEDIHLPLQGLDYWSRVEWHRGRGEFQKFGYFSGRTIADDPALLLLVAPALHVHPTTDTLLSYVSPEIECGLVGIGEQWRDGLRVIFRKVARQGSLRSPEPNIA